MVGTLAPPQAPTAPPPRGRGPRVLLIVLLAVAVVVGLGIFSVGHFGFGRSEPKFASLAEQPDPSLQGTVAYTNATSRCVRIVAAAGQPAKDILCLPNADLSKAVALGTKEDGPQLIWLADGRLEVTMFRQNPKDGTFTAGWQKIVDVGTGAVTDTPAADVPAAPNLTTRATTSPTGQRITTTSNPSSGRIKVTLTDDGGTRTLLSARGPGEYTYSLRAAFWAPNWQWIAADDGRILIITPGNPSVTRVLTDETRGGGFIGGNNSPQLASFAVTEANLLSSN